MRNFRGIKFLRLLLTSLIMTSIYSGAFAFSKDISIQVQSEEFIKPTELFLEKDNLTKQIDIADDRLKEILDEKDKEILEHKNNLDRAIEENKSEEEIERLRKSLEEAEERFKNFLAEYDQETIKVKLKAGFPGPIYFSTEKENCRKPPLFFFDAEGGIKGKIRVCSIKNSNEIEAELIVKNVELINENGEYKLNFDKVRDAIIRFQGKLKGWTEFQFGISPQIRNPISFLDTRSPVGKKFKIEIPIDKIDEDKEDTLHVYFTKDSEIHFSPTLPSGKKENTTYTFEPTVPAQLKGKVNIAAVIIDKNGDIKAFNSSEFMVCSQNYAGIFGAFLTTAAIFLITLLIKGDKKKWWIAPLNFTVTPLGRYSISLLQILIWTTITLFSYIYVYFLKGEFLVFTNQILILLGISGATALSSKAAAVVRMKDIPDKYYKDADGKNDIRLKKRKPKFSDYVSIGKDPNIFKFQILGFTLITAIFVVMELIKTSNFPEIPDELLTLMGISGGVYVSNEIITENVWQKLSDKLEEAKKATGKTKTKLEEEIREKLKKIFD